MDFAGFFCCRSRCGYRLALKSQQTQHFHFVGVSPRIAPVLMLCGKGDWQVFFSSLAFWSQGPSKMIEMTLVYQFGMELRTSLDIYTNERSYSVFC